MNKQTNKTIILRTLLALALLMTAFGAANTFAQSKPLNIKKAVDISCRPALYFGDNVLSSQPINKNSRYVVAGKKIVLTPADSFDNKNGVYSFNIMYILYGSPVKESLALGEFTNRLRIGDELLNQHTVKFSDADKSGATDTNIQFIRTQINLPIGTSAITLSLDDDKAVKESSENNNTYTFTVEVLAKP